MEYLSWELLKADLLDKQREADELRLAKLARKNSRRPSLLRSLMLYFARL